jgi:hypothetical protein
VHFALAWLGAGATVGISGPATTTLAATAAVPAIPCASAIPAVPAVILGRDSLLRLLDCEPRIGGVEGVSVFVGILLVLVGLEEIGGVQESAFFQAYVNEGRLDAGQNCFNPTLVNVSNGAPVVGPVHQQFD